MGKPVRDRRLTAGESRNLRRALAIVKELAAEGGLAVAAAMCDRAARYIRGLPDEPPPSKGFGGRKPAGNGEAADAAGSEPARKGKGK